MSILDAIGIAPCGSKGQLFSIKKRIRRYLALYTLVFVPLCCAVYSWYLFAGRTFIWQGDGWSQHYKALVYYAEYLRSIVRESLTAHRLVFPEWDFALGEGSDILQTLHYYVIGDPFTLFAIFVPTRLLWIYYDGMILLRLYLAGIAFSCLCFYTRKNVGYCAVLAGAITYVFCFWSIYNTSRHPYFLNPMLYFPLIVLGIEKIIRERKPSLLILAVFLSAISNFYFFYVIVILTVFYVAVRLIAEYRTDIGLMLKTLLHIASGSVMGTVMGSVILLPTVINVLSDARMSSGNAWHLYYPLSYYSKLIGTFFSPSGDYWLCMGFAAPVILAVFLLFFRRKQHGMLKVLFLTCMVIILIPAAGQFLNGMSYRSNKWSWAFALLCAYIFTVMWPELMHLSSKDTAKLSYALGVSLLALLMLEYSRTTAAFSGIGIALLFLLTLCPARVDDPETKRTGSRRKQALALLLVIVSVVNVSFFKNATATGKYAAEAKEIRDVGTLLMNTEVNAIEQAAQADGSTDFFRYSGRGVTDNANTLYGLSATQYYWTISNPGIAESMKDLELPETTPQHYKGYDDRVSLLTLSSVLYHVVPSSLGLVPPCGFTLLGEFEVPQSTEKTYLVYRNENALPLGYTYDKVLSEETWNGLSVPEKQEAILQAVLLADYSGKTQDHEVDHLLQSPEYSIECRSEDITLEDYGFVVTKENASVTIGFEGAGASETYFSIQGLDFDGVSTYDLYFGDERYDPLDLYSDSRWNELSSADRETLKHKKLFWSEPTSANLKLTSSSKVTKTITYCTEDNSWYNDRHDFTVNLGYSDTPVKYITLSFSAIGVYSFDSIGIFCQPMENYPKQAAALKRDVLQDVTFGTDTVKGAVTLKEPKILCLSIPYSDGWTAYVDGKETRLYRANVKNMALVLDAGRHTVQLVYKTPWLREGAVLSAAGLSGFVAFLIIRAVRRRKKSRYIPGGEK